MPCTQVKIDFLPSKLFQSGLNQLPPFQDIAVRPKLTSSIPGHYRQAKPTSFIPSRSSQAKTDFFHSKPVWPKPISSSPSHPSQDKTDVLHSKPFQSGQNRLSPFHAIPVRAILSIMFPSSPCLVAAGHRTIQFLFLLRMYPLILSLIRNHLQA
jgi:hypothetical protein